MTRTSIAAALITAALAVGLTACSSDDEATSAPTSTPTTSTSTAPTESAFGTDEFIADRLRTSTSAIVETVEQRGGTPQQAIAALVSIACVQGPKLAWRLPRSVTET